MSRRRLATALLATAAVAASAAPAPAFDLGFGLFKRKKPNDQQPQKADQGLKAKQLTATLQSDTDVDHRKTAAVDLRAQDPRTNADIIPTLIGTLRKDPSPDVRALAAETLGGYKTVYPTAAAALETTEQNDPDKAVRAAAKSALWQYGLSGYKGTAPVVSSQSGEPPLAKPLPAPPATRTASASPLKSAPAEPAFRPITQGPGNAVVYPQTAEPPLAKGKAEPKAAPSVTPPVPQRMPTKLDAVEVLPPKPSIVAPPIPAVSENTPTVPLPLPAVPTVPAVPMVMPTTPAKVPTVVPPGK